MSDKNLKITVGVPSASEYLHRKFVESFMNLQYPVGAQIQYAMVYGVQLPFARNHIVEDALKNGSDFLFFVDVDMIFPANSLIRLLKHNVSICHALSFRRTSPHYPCAFEWDSKNKCFITINYSKSKNDLISVDAAGSACTLIDMSVYKKMKQPYYYYKSHLFSSDLTWSMNAKKLGYNIYIDRTLKIGHLGSEKVITEEYYLNHLSSEAKEKWNQGMKDILTQKRVNEKELYERN